jgi:hypothetical protein
MSLLKEVELKKVLRRADRSLTYTFETLQEGSSEDLMKGDEKIGQRGIMYFADQISDKQKDAIAHSLENDIIEPQMSKSQILRYSILKLAKYKGVDKETFYTETIDKFINHIQGQI